MAGVLVFAAAALFSENDLRYLDSRSLAHQTMPFPWSYALCVDPAEFENMGALPPVYSNFVPTVRATVALMKKASSKLEIQINPSGCAQCALSSAQVNQQDTGFSLDTPLYYSMGTAIPDGRPVGWTYIPSRQRRMQYGCVPLMLNSDRCWTFDDSFCSVALSPVSILIELTLIVLLATLIFRYTGPYVQLTFTVIVFGLGLAQAILVAQSCHCLSSSQVVLHELMHMAGVYHPNQNVQAIVGAHYDPLSVVNSFLLGTLCMSPMDIMSLQHSVGDNVTYYPKQCVHEPSTSGVRALIVLIIVGTSLLLACIGGIIVYHRWVNK